ncbi:hypothetical protein AVEN_116524-1 [Araneus ventricosus]|uniref:Uncharacterized protein n=1 Tax=Araneus ventricosus TaxID=182803 RepID=A0A4Y2TUU2_ARAVE|nr:hypothetical protein AVEN_116524-1 [Araneus ventricosus]
MTVAVTTAPMLVGPESWWPLAGPRPEPPERDTHYHWWWDSEPHRYCAHRGRNQSIGQYLFVHKDSCSNPPTNRRLEEAVVVDWPKMIKFKTS